MKKLVLLMVSLIAVICLSGCTGIITGHEYSKSDYTILYKVAKGGVTTFMTQEEIEKAKLDKVNIVVTDTWKAIEGNAAQ